MRGLTALLLVLAPAALAQNLAVDLTTYRLEDLEISAPRYRVPKSAVIDPQINMHLLRLLRQRQDARPDSQALLDSSIGNLGKISTVKGYQLKTRYTELGFLLTEGLAGVTDLELTSELERTVRQGSNVQTRAAAMVALAYTRDLRYLGLFQGALIDQNVTVRLGALESLLILGSPAVQFQVANAARDDRSPVMQIYAAAGLWRMGDVTGREILLRMARHTDWFLRAMAVRYLGELGGAEEYRKLMQQLTFEPNASVKAELVSALLNLDRFKDR
ncbi:MAG: HEAT repeat domain-containing protein [Elusimicrobiota bacterium]